MAGHDRIGSRFSKVHMVDAYRNLYRHFEKNPVIDPLSINGQLAG